MLGLSLPAWIMSKVAGPVASALAVLLAVGLLWTWTADHAQLALLKHDNSSLRSQIDDPRTGFRARLAASQASYQSLGDASAKQTAAVNAWKQAAADANARAQKASNAADGALKQAEANAARIQATKPGDDVCMSAYDVLQGTIK